ncbi:PEP-CTERM sorting domain-containing protein [Xylophilus rhododendri]|uniref:PEP-CTERM sorting domain-containing protein n=1 Tax=Xylophilus rhododendri TaxID=2697032 RepID=A0A857JB92_9BURK|nr:PEP-CTERM sorting domain-containing protein [Xylophilus rhododendri]QHJ00243.1 PEP-CTERM sorting domain-containing protein [Xylophilus rhododendri]
MTGHFIQKDNPMKSILTSVCTTSVLALASAATQAAALDLTHFTTAGSVNFPTSTSAQLGTAGGLFGNVTDLISFDYVASGSNAGMLIMSSTAATVVLSSNFANSGTYTFTTPYTGAIDFTITASLPVSATISNLQVAAVPEPESYAMLAGGLGLLGCTARRRRKPG